MRYLYLIIIVLVISLQSYVSKAENLDSVLEFTHSEHKNQFKNISITDEANALHYIEEYEGSLVLIVFWASWSTESVEYIINLDILKKDLKKLKIKILPVSIDYKDAEDVKKFYKKYDIKNLDIFYDRKLLAYTELKPNGIPAAFLINEEGYLLGKFNSHTNWSHTEIRNIILKYVPKENANEKK